MILSQLKYRASARRLASSVLPLVAFTVMLSIGNAFQTNTPGQVTGDCVDIHNLKKKTQSVRPPQVLCSVFCVLRLWFRFRRWVHRSTFWFVVIPIISYPEYRGSRVCFDMISHVTAIWTQPHLKSHPFTSLELSVNALTARSFPLHLNTCMALQIKSVVGPKGNEKPCVFKYFRRVYMTSWQEEKKETLTL